MSISGTVRRRCDAVYVARGGVLRTAASIQGFLVGCEVEPDDRIVAGYLAGTLHPNTRQVPSSPFHNSNNISPSKDVAKVNLSSNSGGGSPRAVNSDPPTSARQRLRAVASVGALTARRMKSSVTIDPSASTCSPDGLSPKVQSPTIVPASATGPQRIPLDDCYWLVKECLSSQAKRQVSGNDEQLLAMAWSAFAGSTDVRATARVSDFENQIESFGLRCSPVGGQPAASPTSTSNDFRDVEGDSGSVMRFDDLISILTIDKEILLAVSKATSTVQLPTALLRTLTPEEQQKAHRLARALFRLKLMLRAALAFRKASKEFERSFGIGGTVTMAPLPSSDRLKALRHGGGAVEADVGGGGYQRVQSRGEWMATVRRLSLFDHDAIGARCRRHSHSHSVVDCFTPTRSPSPYGHRAISPESSNAGSPAKTPLPRIQPGFSSAKLQGDLIRERTLLPPLQDDRRVHTSIVKRLQKDHRRLGKEGGSMSPSVERRDTKEDSAESRSPVFHPPRLLSSRHDDKQEHTVHALSPNERVQFWKQRLQTIASSPSSSPHTGTMTGSVDYNGTLGGSTLPSFQSTLTKRQHHLPAAVHSRDFCCQVSQNEILEATATAATLGAGKKQRAALSQRPNVAVKRKKVL